MGSQASFDDRRRWNATKLEVLHVTNGESAIESMKRAGLRGEFLSWDDALHDGPAPAGLSLSEFSARRATFLVECGLSDLEGVRLRFQERDQALSRFRAFQEVVLWFEHDLYDQLQLIQLLDWFGDQALGSTRLFLVQTDQYLGETPGEFYPGLMEGRREVEPEQLDLARQVWAAFTSPDPTAIERARATRLDPLPHLDAALLRHLEEFPSLEEGLGRTERQILKAVSHGHNEPVAIFLTCQDMEEARFQGDWSFWLQMDGLSRGPRPLLRSCTGPFLRPPLLDNPSEFRKQRLSLSADGEAVLAGSVDRIRLNGYRRWLGGALLEAGHLWRWDRSRKQLIARH